MTSAAQATAQEWLAEAHAYEIDLINQKIAQSEYYIQYLWMQAWDGKLPTTVFGDENIDLLLQGYVPN